MHSNRLMWMCYLMFPMFFFHLLLSKSMLFENFLIKVQWHCKIWICCNGKIRADCTGTLKTKWDLTKYRTWAKAPWPRRVLLVTGISSHTTNYVHIYCLKYICHIGFLQGHDWNRWASVLDASFEFILCRGDKIYL